MEQVAPAGPVYQAGTLSGDGGGVSVRPIRGPRSGRRGPAGFNRIKLTMPEDGPGRLSDQEYTDVVAYMLDRNDYPAGENELSTDKAELDRIMIVAAE